MKFAPEEGVDFFARFGWRPLDVRSYAREAGRLRRGPWWFRLLSRLPDVDPKRPGKRPWAAIVRFERI